MATDKELQELSAEVYLGVKYLNNAISLAEAIGLQVELEIDRIDVTTAGDENPRMSTGVRARVLKYLTGSEGK